MTTADIDSALATLEAAVAAAERAELPALLGHLEVVKASVLGRLVQPPHAAPPVAPPEHGALTQEAVAGRYRIPLRTVRRLTRARILPSVVVGRNRMLRPVDVDTYIARCRAQGVRIGTRLDV